MEQWDSSQSNILQNICMIILPYAKFAEALFQMSRKTFFKITIYNSQESKKKKNSIIYSPHFKRYMILFLFFQTKSPLIPIREGRYSDTQFEVGKSFSLEFW